MCYAISDMEYRRHPERYLLQWLTAPFIYAVIVPVLLLDLIMELYHRFSFPIYGLELVRRGAYIRIDRHKLAYLNWFEKLNCLYCGYVNGFLRYAGEIAHRSEWYWCGIMHQKTEGFIMPPYQRDFLRYGDAEAFHKYVGDISREKAHSKKRSRRKRD